MEEERGQPLSPAGRLYLRPETYHVVNAALVVEFPLDPDAIKAAVRSSALVEHPRFRSVLVRDSSGRDFWRKTEIDVDRHVIVRNQISGGQLTSDEDAVNDYLADLSVSSPLPSDKPLWEIHLLIAHRTMVIRMHHALGDGISLMSMLLSCCRRMDDPTQTPMAGGVGAAPRRRWSVWTLLMAVWYTVVYALDFILRVMWLGDQATAVSGGAGVELWPRKLATARFRLDDMKTVKRAVADATINDVLFGVISCGLSRYLSIKSSKALPEGLRITGAALVNMRPQPGLQDLSVLMDSKSGTRWGNNTGMLLLPLYYHKDSSDPVQFVRRAKQMIDKKKLSLEGSFVGAVGLLLMSLFGDKILCDYVYRIVSNTTFTISNVFGPKEKITAAGNPVKHIRVTSTSQPNALSMLMVSYAGAAELQISVAKEVIPDPKVLAKCFEDALLEMKQSAAGGKCL